MVKAHFEKIRNEIIDEIDLATNEIVVAVYWFTNQELFEKLIKKVEKGIKVQLIIHNDYINNREKSKQFRYLSTDNCIRILELSGYEIRLSLVLKNDGEI